MKTIRINVLDKKGNRLGRDYDYEYRGRAREFGRATQPGRLRVRCWFAILLLLALSVWPVASSLIYTEKVEPKEMYVFLFFGIFFAAYIYILLRISLSKHKKLYERLDGYIPQGPK